MLRRIYHEHTFVASIPSPPTRSSFNEYTCRYRSSIGGNQRASRGKRCAIAGSQ